MTQQVILLAGWGYWDTTQYPYGGCFRRATEDMPVEIIERLTIPKHTHETKIQFPDGKNGMRTAVVLNESLKTS